MNKNTRQYIRTFKFKSIYYRLFTLLICLIIVPSIFTGVFIYNKSSHNFQQQMSTYYLATLDYIKDETINMFNAADIICTQYAMDEDVKHFADKDLFSDRILLTKIYQNINNTILANPFIDSIYIYYKNTNQIITNNGIYSFSDFYDQSWYYTVEEMKNKSVFLPTRSFIEKIGSTKNEKQVISVVRFFPAFSSKDSGVVVVNVGLKETQKKISKIVSDGKGNAFVIDESGTILLSNKGQYSYRNLYDILGISFKNSSSPGHTVCRFEKEKVLASYTQSPIRGWMFVQLMPLSEITKSIDFIKNTLIFVFIIMSIIAFAVVSLLSNKIYSFIAHIMDIVNDKKFLGKEELIIKNEFEALKYGVNGISNAVEEEKKKNILLENQLDQSKEILLKSCFKDLIIYKEQDENSIINRLNLLSWADGKHILIMISIDDMEYYEKRLSREDKNLCQNTINAIIYEILGKQYKIIAFKDNYNNWTIVANIMDLDDSEAYNKTGLLCDDIRQRVIETLNGITVSISIGTVSRDLRGLPQSYSHALKAMSFRWIKGKNTTLKYIQINEAGKYYYNTAMEKAIINYLKKNELTEAKKALDKFLKELVDSNSEDYNSVYQGVLQLLFSVLKSICDMGYGLKEVFKKEYENKDYNIINDFKKQETLKDAEIWLKERFNSISNFLWEKYEGKGEFRISKIKAYIDENFKEDICLTNISQKFGLSECFISKTFKQVTGENFFDYLTKVRIEKAKELLKNSPYTINDISKLVGYENVQSFIRIFKKSEGMTPGQYRECVRFERE